MTLEPGLQATYIYTRNFQRYQGSSKNIARFSYLFGEAISIYGKSHFRLDWKSEGLISKSVT
jgi:hypothetical protein